MIGSAMKKLARQYNLVVSDGVAYGSLMGYTTTMSDGAGCKLIEISTTFPQLTQKDAFYAAVNSVDTARIFQVQKLDIGNRHISIAFVGNTKQIENFINWFFPLLQQYGATYSNVCAHCGGDATMGGWYIVEGRVHRFHDSCAQHLSAAMESEKQAQLEQSGGSYAQGFLGAFLGAALGAIAWALVYALGYFASIIGLLIGWLADKGYNLLHGKQGKGKVAILVIMVILAVVAGTLGGLMLGFYWEVSDFVDFSEVPELVFELMEVDEEVSSAFIGDVVMGLLFAGLGVFATLKKAANDVSNVKFKRLG